MGVWAAALEALTLEPIFGVKPWAGTSRCPDVHHGPLPSGSKCCCMSCNQTGIERHPALKESARDRIRMSKWRPPETGDQWTPMETAEPTRYTGPIRAAIKLTRTEWRDIQYGRRAAPPGYEIDPMHRGFLRPMDPDAINAAVSRAVAG